MSAAKMYAKKLRLLVDVDAERTRKLMLQETGERQVKKKWAQVDLDHRMRYEFAASLISDGARVADVGCGIGYGSYFMATSTPCQFVLGADISEEAIEYAKSFYLHPKITFLRADALKLQTQINVKFDLITAFEVVEHIENAEEFLTQLAEMVTENGIIVLSTPNESIMPFNKDTFRFHHRHYTLDELNNLVCQAGLDVIYCLSQNGTVVYGFPGNAMHIFVCHKKGGQKKLINTIAVADTQLNRMMACFERIDWLLNHVPQKNTKELVRQLVLVSPEEPELYHHLVMRKDAFFRRFTPETCRDNPNFSDVIGCIQEGTLIEQVFPCDKDGICAVSVLAATYAGKFAGRLIAALYHKEQNIIAFRMFSEIRDNDEIVMRFPPIRNSAGKDFRLELYLETLVKGSALTFYQTEQMDGTSLYKNGQRIEKTLTYRMLFE